MAMEENQLISAAQRGNLAAFNQLIGSYQGLAFNIAYSLLGDADSACDATQDAFLKAYLALARYHGGSFKAWLSRIITNTCYDQLRAARRRPTTSLDSIPDPEYCVNLIDRRRQPAESAEDQELRAVIQLGMRALPAEQRTVIVLSDVEGYSYEEICQVTGMTMGTVKSRLSRARAKMRDFLVAQPNVLTGRISQNHSRVDTTAWGGGR